MTLQWKPPQNPNGDITHYSVQYDENSVIDDFGNIMSDTITGKIGGLSSETKYTLHLRAHTRVGEGPSASVTVKTGKSYNKTATV